MSYALDLALDQERIEQQDHIAEDLHSSGFTDALVGNKPELQDTPYLMGYLKGMRHKQLEIKLEAQLLDFEARQVEELAASIFGEEF